jgi:hypothetical protein
MAKSTSKKKLSAAQKSVLDEIYILNALRCVMKGLAITCRYMKVSGLIKSPESEHSEKVRISNRLTSFKNCLYFLDLSYKRFVKDTSFDLKSQKEMILQSADS